MIVEFFYLPEPLPPVGQVPSKEGDAMSQKVKLVPYEPHMGADFVPYEAVEDQLYGAPDTTSSPEQSKNAEAPVPTQPK